MPDLVGVPKQPRRHFCNRRGRGMVHDRPSPEIAAGLKALRKRCRARAIGCSAEVLGQSGLASLVESRDDVTDLGCG